MKGTDGHVNERARMLGSHMVVEGLLAYYSTMKASMRCNLSFTVQKRNYPCSASEAL